MSKIKRKCQKIKLKTCPFCGSKVEAFEMVGVELGVTRERVRQIQQHALRKLKRPKIKKTLDNLL